MAREKKVSPIDVQKALTDMRYPSNKDEIVKHAKEHKASKEVVDVLNKIPQHAYNSAADVSHEIGMVQKR